MKKMQMITQKMIDELLAERPDKTKNQQYRCKKHTRQHQGGGCIRQLENFVKHNVPTLMMASVLIACVLMSPTLGVAVEDLKAPVKDLKDTIFGGWMWVPKIGAAVGGCLLAVYNQSIMPLATGAGVGLGIHFYELYINADAALI